MFSYNCPVEVWRTGAVVASAYTSRPDWNEAVQVWAGLAAVQPGRPYESYTPSRDVSQDRRTVFLPPGADVSDTDRLRLEGAWWEIDGAPRVYTQTSRAHIRLTAWRAIR